MKTIALFGATGKTGSPFLKKALEKGYAVKALVRNPSKIGQTHPQLTIVQGDITNQADVDKTIAGTDVVVNLSGHVKGSPANMQVQFIGHVITAMKKHNLKRIIALTGGGVRDLTVDKPGFMDNLIVFIMKNLAGSGTRNALIDGRNHVELLRSEKGLEYTIVRAPMLNGDPEKGSWVVGNVGTVKGIKLTRNDLASFILNEIEQNKYIGQMPFVTNG